LPLNARRCSMPAPACAISDLYPRISMLSEWSRLLRHGFKMVGLAALVTIGGCGSMPIGVDAPTNATLEAASAAYNEPESTEETNNDVGSRGGGGQRRPELMSSARKKGSMPDLRKINTLVSDPVAERERTAKLADEQQRRWDATARRATTSICAGC
jgi:hypothetical protein